MSLFVLSSRDGWVNIMYTGLDAVGVNQQVRRHDCFGRKLPYDFRSLLSTTRSGDYYISFPLYCWLVSSCSICS